jgi:hypothetical protein
MSCSCNLQQTILVLKQNAVNSGHYVSLQQPGTQNHFASCGTCSWSEGDQERIVLDKFILNLMQISLKLFDLTWAWHSLAPASFVVFKVLSCIEWLVDIDIVIGYSHMELKVTDDRWKMAWISPMARPQTKILFRVHFNLTIVCLF